VHRLHRALGAAPSAHSRTTKQWKIRHPIPCRVYAWTSTGPVPTIRCALSLRRRRTNRVPLVAISSMNEGTTSTHRSPVRVLAMWVWCFVCVSGALTPPSGVDGTGCRFVAAWLAVRCGQWRVSVCLAACRSGDVASFHRHLSLAVPPRCSDTCGASRALSVGGAAAPPRGWLQRLSP
jgi:hypothetical protein